MGKISIIGAGFVGSTAAYALFIRRVASEIALIDVHGEKAAGHALDLEHGMQFASRTKITYGSSHSLCKGSDIVVIAAGRPQKPGETRPDLIKGNAEIFRELIPAITKSAPNAVLMVVSNPVDALTYLALKYSRLPPSRVFGTGTALDTARFRYLLGEHYDMDPRSVHAYLLGEHGDSSFPLWSSANVAGIPLKNLPDYNRRKLDSVFQQAKRAAYEVIARKGSTYYAIGLVISELAHAILSDSNSVYPVSTMLKGYHGERNVCLSVPCVLGKGGIKRQLTVPMDSSEMRAFKKSAAIIRKSLRGV